ncbi:MAG: cellulase family glycosylhydrolase [Candidatus Dormibacteria bacterium]
MSRNLRALLALAIVAAPGFAGMPVATPAGVVPTAGGAQVGGQVQAVPTPAQSGLAEVLPSPTSSAARSASPASTEVTPIQPAATAVPPASTPPNLHGTLAAPVGLPPVLATANPGSAAPSPAPPRASTGFVSRAGRGLSLNGSPFRFAGLNIYNANSRSNCWYTLGQGPDLDQALADAGPNVTVVRAWFFQSLATVNGNRDWSAFDHTLAAARAHGIRVIATLGNQWGDCEESQPVYKTEAWYTAGYRANTEPTEPLPYRAWVEEVAARYRGDTTVMAWQLMNEAEDLATRGGVCSPTANLSLRAFAADTSSLLKATDPNHLVSLGTIGSGQCGATGDPGAYRALHALPGIDLCEYHDYGHPSAPMPGDQWNGLQARLDDCAAVGKPLFVGETGISTTEAGSAAARAADFSAKFRAQFAAGVVGELVWDWRSAAQGGSAGSPGSLAGDSYDVGPGDPVLSVLRLV